MIFPIPRRHSSSVIAREEMISLEKYAGTHGSLGSVKARGRNKSAKPRLKSMPRGRSARTEREKKERERERKERSHVRERKEGRKEVREARREVREQRTRGQAAGSGWVVDDVGERGSCVWQIVDIGRRPDERGGRGRRSRGRSSPEPAVRSSLCRVETPPPRRTFARAITFSTAT